MKTPKNEKKPSEVAEKEKLSGKKLVQARLPFKILSTPPTTDGTARKDAEKDSGETRKRKLSYDNEDGAPNQATKKKSVKTATVSDIERKKKQNDSTGNGSLNNQPDVVLLSDSNDECNVSCSKENVKSTRTTTAKILIQKHFESDHESDMHSDDVELVESTDEESQKIEAAMPVKSVTATPVNAANEKHKNEKKTITPKSAGKGSGKDHRKSAGEITAEQTKVLIKLPVSGKKNKRRKTSIQLSENADEHLNSDDVELASPVSQPQKRVKLESLFKKQQDIAQKLNIEKNQTKDDSSKTSSETVKIEELNATPDKKSIAKATSSNPPLKEIKSPKSNNKKEQQKKINSSNDKDKKLEATSKGKEPPKATTSKNEPLKGIKTPKTYKKQEKKTDHPEEVKIISDEYIENTVEVMQTEVAASAEPNELETATQNDFDKVLPEKSSKDVAQAFEEETTESDTSKSKVQEISSSSTDAEADAETETTVKNDVLQLEAKESSSVDTPTTPKVSNETTSNKLHKKNLTPKQQKLLEQRLKAREEKERKIQEERLQKQREKEERELAKKREREEKEEQKRKEREEKEEQRRKEREEKERKRLAELEIKNEEKRKRNEAKEEEIRKKEEERKRKEQEKEDERKRKEQEKEEAELKKKKAAMAFTKFFSRPTTEKATDKCKAHEERQNENIVLAFRPFQIKGAMKLAPTVRKTLTNEAISTLDMALQENKEFPEEKLYVKQLKAGQISPHKWVRPFQKDADELNLAEEPDDDVILVEDELERAGQAIVEEPIAPVERLRVKFFKFAENRRPPYYGTWRKKSKDITPRKPFAQDKKFFDYEIDSDDEWEEEEPGESLDGSDDEKEKESEDEDYEVDNEWFVPHGHLSDEELQGEDDLGENNDREAQKAKLQILQKEFAQEMKKKTEKIKPRLIGCIWVDENGNQPELCPKIIWNTLNTRAILCSEPPVLEEIESSSDKNIEANVSNTQGIEKTSGEIKLKPITLSEDMLKQLVRLVHGNTHSKNFMIKEFIAYIEANEESVRNGDVKGPLKSTVREKIDEYAQWQVVEKTDDAEKDNGSNTKKKKNKKKLCWVVSAEKLQEMEMENLELKNNWQYILQPRVPRLKVKTDANLPTLPQAEDSNENSEASAEQTGSPSSKIKPKTDITKFTKVLTAAEKAQQLQKSKEILKTPSTKRTVITPSSTKSTQGNSTNNNITPTVKKRVPLLMSVARGQTISTPDKNARISQFLKTLNDTKQQEKAQTVKHATPPIQMDVDEVVSLD